MKLYTPEEIHGILEMMRCRMKRGLDFWEQCGFFFEGYTAQEVCLMFDPLLSDEYIKTKRVKNLSDAVIDVLLVNPEGCGFRRYEDNR